jgi:hypothetical protein
MRQRPRVKASTAGATVAGQQLTAGQQLRTVYNSTLPPALLLQHVYSKSQQCSMPVKHIYLK